MARSSGLANLTWLQQILAVFEGAGDRLNQRFDEAGLARLADWSCARPDPLRQSDCPYGWFELGGWPADDRPEPRPSGGPSLIFAVPVTVTLAFSGASANELLQQVVRYLPQVMAALEGAHGDLVVATVDWRPLPEHQNAHFRCDAIRFVVSGERLPGRVN